MIAFAEDANSYGNIMNCVITLFLFTFNLHTDLQAFLKFVTGRPEPIGQVFVTFEDDEGADAISANTCGRQISLSTHIEEQSLFIAAIKALIQD